jgi:hypothetical protein
VLPFVGWKKRTRLRRLAADHTYGLDSVIAGVVGAIFLLIGGMLHLLWNPKSLKEVTVWRGRVEGALQYGTGAIIDEWMQRGLPLPVGNDELRDEFAKAQKQEHELQKARKLVIVMFLVLGTLLIIAGLAWR